MQMQKEEVGCTAHWMHEYWGTVSVSGCQVCRWDGVLPLEKAVGQSTHDQIDWTINTCYGDMLTKGRL